MRKSDARSVPFECLLRPINLKTLLRCLRPSWHSPKRLVGGSLVLIGVVLNVTFEAFDPYLHGAGDDMALWLVVRNVATEYRLIQPFHDDTTDVVSRIPDATALLKHQ